MNNEQENKLETKELSPSLPIRNSLFSDPNPNKVKKEKLRMRPMRSLTKSKSMKPQNTLLEIKGITIPR